MIREGVLALMTLGPLPHEDAPEDEILSYERAMESIAPPVTQEEAVELVKLFGQDDCYGLAWTLLHLIETAPSCPVRQEPDVHANQGVRRLWERRQRSAYEA